MTYSLMIKQACIVVTGCLLSFIVAAQTVIDLTPPAITHTTPADFTPGKAVAIEIDIVDDSGIEDARLFYRPGQAGEYQSIPLILSFADRYTAEIPTESNQKILQYYIEALDNGGNRVLEGNPSQPLVVNAAEGRSNILYIVLGALAVGALVAAGVSDDGGGTDDNRTVSITATVPE